MKLEFRVKEFKSNRQPRSFTDMMTMQESGTFNIQYRTEGKGRWKQISNLSISPENVDKALLTLQTNSSLWYNGRNYRNGVLNEEIEPLY